MDNASVVKPRMYYLDHLRVSLVVLVVLHHLAAVYGAVVPFYYVEPPFTNPRAFQVLLIFMLVNQSFFMGILFFLAGYFTPQSYDRKGPVVFLREKLLRLGIPLVVFVFLLNPVSSIGSYLMPEYITGITVPLTWADYTRFIGLGPIWFLAMLLVFIMGSLLWRRVSRKRAPASTARFSKISYLGIGIFTVCLAAASYLIRTAVPMGKTVLGFPTLSYLPQYLSFFVIGAVASRRGWLESLSGKKGGISFGVAVGAAVVLFPLAFSGRFFSLSVTAELGNAMGNGHWQSGLFALWDSFFAVGMGLGLITLYRRFFNREHAVGKFLSRHSFMVYIVHTPVVVFLAYLIRGISLPTLPKLGIAALIIVPACFVVACLLKKIPGVSRIV